MRKKYACLPQLYHPFHLVFGVAHHQFGDGFTRIEALKEDVAELFGDR